MCAHVCFCVSVCLCVCVCVLLLQVESALVQHPAVAEAAVIGIPHDIKGTAMFAYVILKQSHCSETNAGGIPKELKDQVRE